MIELSPYHLNELCRLLERSSETLDVLVSPAYRLRPQLSKDVGRWRAVYGESVENGVVGFGFSPEEAFADFDRKWTEKLSAPTASMGGPSASDLVRFVASLSENEKKSLRFEVLNKEAVAALDGILASERVLSQGAT